MKIVSKIFRIAAITFCLMVIVLAGIRQFVCFMLGYGGGIATVFGFIFSSNVRNHTYSYIAILDSGKEEIVSSGLRSTDYVSFAVLPGFPALLYALIYFVLNHILPLVVVFICIFAIVHLCFKKPKPTLLRLECLFAVLLLIL